MRSENLRLALVLGGFVAIVGSLAWYALRPEPRSEPATAVAEVVPAARAVSEPEEPATFQLADVASRRTAAPGVEVGTPLAPPRRVATGPTWADVLRPVDATTRESLRDGEVVVFSEAGEITYAHFRDRAEVERLVDGALVRVDTDRHCARWIDGGELGRAVAARSGASLPLAPSARIEIRSDDGSNWQHRLFRIRSFPAAAWIESVDADGAPSSYLEQFLWWSAQFGYVEDPQNLASSRASWMARLRASPFYAHVATLAAPEHAAAGFVRVTGGPATVLPFVIDDVPAGVAVRVHVGTQVPIEVVAKHGGVEIGLDAPHGALLGPFRLAPGATETVVLRRVPPATVTCALVPGTVVEKLVLVPWDPDPAARGVRRELSFRAQGGVYELTDLVASNFHFVFRGRHPSLGRIAEDLEFELAPGEVRDLGVLDGSSASASLVLRPELVVVDRTGAPAPVAGGATCKLWLQSPPRPDGSWVVNEPIDVVPMGVDTRIVGLRPGPYTVTVLGAYLVGPGARTMRAAEPRFATTIDVAGESRLEFDVHVEATTYTTIVVRPPSDLKRPGIGVWAWLVAPDESEVRPLDLRWIDGADGPGIAVSRSHLPCGRWDLVVRVSTAAGPGGDFAASRQTVELVLGENAEVEARPDHGAAVVVLDPPSPTGAVPVHLVAAALADEPFGWWSPVVTGTDGSLRFEGLPPNTVFELRPGGRRVESGPRGSVVTSRD